jgi:hypothetical protein
MYLFHDLLVIDSKLHTWMYSFVYYTICIGNKLCTFLDFLSIAPYSRVPRDYNLKADLLCVFASTDYSIFCYLYFDFLSLANTETTDL